MKKKKYECRTQHQWYIRREKKSKIPEDRDWNIKGIYDIFNEII